MNKPILAAMLLAGATLGLGACSGGTEDTAATDLPDGVPGLTVTEARLILPAVEGNPGAVYFELDYDGDKNIAIRSADVSGATRAELHETVEWDGEMVMGEMGPLMMQPGDTASFEPGGRHVMAFELSPDLQPGGTTEVTLIVAGGDKTSFTAEIKGAGEDR